MTKALMFVMSMLLVLPGLAFNPAGTAQAQKLGGPRTKTQPPVPIDNQPGLSGKTYQPTNRTVETAAPVNVLALEAQAALEPAQTAPAEIRAIAPPKGDRPTHTTVPIVLPPDAEAGVTGGTPAAPPPSATGVSPGATKSFKGEFLSGTTIPPDTMGAVGTTHIVTVTNDRMRIQTREGVELSRVTINSFWATATVKGVAVTSAFDTKCYFDRFNSRFVLISSLNGPGINSGGGVAVTQTADPTGTWNRFTFVADPAATASAGHAIDYPSVGINKNWIVVDENTFNYSGANFSSYFGQQIFVLDKAAAYANTLSSISLFEGAFSTCLASATQETELGCGFTMAPAITEDNTTNTDYIVEDWDSQAAQLRMSKITGTASAPVLTVGTQFPQSTNSWRFDAARIGTTGGYAPQKQQSAYLTSGTRIANNDSRIQNCVLRNGSLWTVHHVMLAQTPTAAGVAVGGTTNPDTHSAIQWWQINPTIETGLSVPALQRARIEDPTADNCHDGAAGTRTTGTCTSTLTQVGQFYAFPNISVNVNGDVLIGFTQFSALTYPSSAYAYRATGDPVNTTRDPVVYRPGQANYNIGSGTGGTSARNNRWGDYSGSQTDPLNDTDFWVVQEYAGTVRDFGIGLAGNWETYWAQIKPTTAAPIRNGSLVISEFRLRGPQGVRDEYVELYNPILAPVIVNTTDNSDGWALAYSPNGTTVTGVAVIPNGTVIPAHGYFLIANNPDGATGPTLVYSLNGYPNTQVRGADSDTGYSIDLADNGGLAIFKTSKVANFNPSTRMDSVGFVSVTPGLFKEGNGIPNITASTPTGQLAFFRETATTGGVVERDSDTNETDFVFVDPAIETLTVGPKLGAAGPQNLDSPVYRNGTVKIGFIDAACISNGAATTACARVRDLTPVTNGTLGTLSLRRKFTNMTGAPVTRLRFRMSDFTSCTIQPCTPGASTTPGTADLRVLTSADIPAATITGGGTALIRGLTLEEPPTQTNGGGLNSTVTAGTISLSAPLAAGATINVQFLYGVQQSGTYRVFVVVEGLP